MSLKRRFYRFYYVLFFVHLSSSEKGAFKSFDIFCQRSCSAAGPLPLAHESSDSSGQRQPVLNWRRASRTETARQPTDIQAWKSTMELHSCWLEAIDKTVSSARHGAKGPASLHVAHVGVQLERVLPAMKGLQLHCNVQYHRFMTYIKLPSIYLLHICYISNIYIYVQYISIYLYLSLSISIYCISIYLYLLYIYLSLSNYIYLYHSISIHLTVCPSVYLLCTVSTVFIYCISTLSIYSIDVNPFRVPSVTSIQYGTVAPLREPLQPSVHTIL